MKKIIFLSLLALTILLTSFANTAFSHSYHYEIQISTELYSVKNQLTGLRMNWLYDEDVSSVMTQDQTDLNKLKNKLISDLASLAYFTELKINGKVEALGKATNVSLVKKGDALELSFSLPLKKPVTVKRGTTLNLNHADPGSIAIIYYDQASDVIVNGPLKKQCKPTVKEKGDFKEGEFPQLVNIYC